MFKDIAYLINKTKSTDDAGDIVEVEVKKQVFCNFRSVGQTEFYQAMSSGLKPEIKLDIRNIEYQNEKQVEYNSRTYDVIRTFISEKNSEILELTLGGGINGTT